jgi:hypothetical protein
MDNSRRAFVLMPFGPPFNSYYPAIFKPALEAVGYDVTRADDLFKPQPIMLDIQESILAADLILCEMSGRNPNVFYELGLAHAVGKPAILISRREEDIPFNLRHVRVILYDFTEAGWEAKLRADIEAAAQVVATSNKIWPPPLIGAQSKEYEQEIAADRAREDALQDYLDRMSELLLDNNLQGSNAGDVVRDVARTRTLAILKDLVEDQKGRKGQVVRFLYEAGLIRGLDETGQNKAIIDLRSADLQGINLILTDLTGANLAGANLTQAYLSFANLKNANLSNALLLGADLSSADLEGTDLTDADLGYANLSGAKNLTYQQMAKAKYLDGAILPDELEMPEEAREEFEKRYRQ